MTQVWVYSIGPELASPLGNTSLLQYARDLIASELQEPVMQSECSINIWVPFRSERDYRGKPQFIVLLVGDWRKLSRNDYFVAANALALHESGVARLLPALIGNVDSPEGSDPWLERYRQLWERLKEMAVTGPEWARELASRLKHLASRSEDPSKPDGRSVSVFFSYCHRDEGLRDELARHLKLLERTGLIEGWHDRRIRPGEEWSAEIDRHLYTSDLILLLLSSDFFASDYCSEIETPVALARHNRNGARAIPVVLRPVVWKHSPLAALQALPTDARPVTSWDSLDSAFVDVCEGIIGAALAWKGQGPLKEIPQAPRFSARKRVVDAAMPAQVEVDKSAMLVVLIRKPLSAGLRDLLAGDMDYGVEPEDVRSKPLSLQFLVSPANKLENISLTVLVKAPDFDPPEQQKVLTVQPGRDSPPLIFMLAARKAGALKAVVEICVKDELLTSCPLGTIAVPAAAFDRRSPNIASASFDVGDPTFVAEPAKPASAAGTTPREAPRPEPAELAGAQAAAREERITQMLAEAEQLIASSRLEQACALLRIAQREFPDEQRCQALLIELEHAQQNSAIEKMQQEAIRLLKQNRPSEALDVLNEALRISPDAKKSVTLNQTLASAREQQKRQEALRPVGRDTFLGSHSPSKSAPGDFTQVILPRHAGSEPLPAPPGLEPPPPEASVRRPKMASASEARQGLMLMVLIIGGLLLVAILALYFAFRV